MVRSLYLIITVVFTIYASITNAFAPQHQGMNGAAPQAAKPLSSSVSVSTSSNNPNSPLRNIPTTALDAHNRDSLTMMPAVLDKPAVRTEAGGPAVLDRPTIERTKEKAPSKETKRVGSEAWEVRIYNDGTNTREFVARCLVQITGLSELTAYQTMMQAHQNGVAVVGRYVYEIAEMYHNALKKNGIVCDLVPVDEEK